MEYKHIIIDRMDFEHKEPSEEWAKYKTIWSFEEVLNDINKKVEECNLISPIYKATTSMYFQILDELYCIRKEMIDYLCSIMPIKRINVQSWEIQSKTDGLLYIGTDETNMYANYRYFYNPEVREVVEIRVSLGD